MRFIGNKTKLLHEIANFMHENGVRGETFCDIFSGTSSVGDYFKSSYKIISNDFLKFSNDIAKAKLWNTDMPDFASFKEIYKADPFTYFNRKVYEYADNFYVTNNYSPKGNRKYFSYKNAIKIDGMRIDFEEVYKNKVFNEVEYYFMLASLLESTMRFSNTSGTYEAFLKVWDKRALKDFTLMPIEFFKHKIRTKNEVFNEDVNFLIRKIKGDILYIDPPYTTTEYSSAYHVLETISRYDYPEISGITGRRVYNDKKSVYTRKKEALVIFEDLIRQAKFNHIVISYSNESIIPIDILENMLKKYAVHNKVIVKRISYRKYENLRKSQKSRGLFECLIYFQKNNEVIKSPLNYAGSKNKLIPQIEKYLPGHIDSFVDVMGGAFNVGVNVVSNEVIYNEYNPYVYGVIKTLLTSDAEYILKHVDERINAFSLSRGNSDNFNAFRDYYNSHKTPLDLFVLSMFAFQNQLRFNSSFEFNTPVGNCAFNKTLSYRICNFKPKTQKLKLTNLDFKRIDYTKFTKDSLFYFDPPYFITIGSYNDGKRGFDGWNADLETNLLKYITTLHNAGYKFMLSNIIYHKNKTNHILKEWIDTHKFNMYELQSGVRKEVLICNYGIMDGKR